MTFGNIRKFAQIDGKINYSIKEAGTIRLQNLFSIIK